MCFTDRMPHDSVYTELVFEWDPRKADANAAKHGVSFDEAVTLKNGFGGWAKPLTGACSLSPLP